MQEPSEEVRTRLNYDRLTGRTVKASKPGSRLVVRSPVHELNHQCVELLARAAWEDKPTLPLARQLQTALRSASDEVLARAAQRPFLLLDFELMNRGWWELARKHPTRRPSSMRAGHFPKAAAIQLGRGATALLRHTFHSDGKEAVLLGAHPVVLQILQSLSSMEIERIVERCFQDVRARWEDRPAIWNLLLQAAAAGDVRLSRNFNLRALHLLTGELL